MWKPVHYVANTVVITVALTVLFVVLIVYSSDVHRADDKVRIAKVEACKTLNDQTAIALCVREVNV